MMRINNTLLDELGLRFRCEFAGDRLFYVALIAAPFSLLVLTCITPSWRIGIRPGLSLVLSFVIWQPLVEELLFRGAIQGQLRKHAWARLSLCKLSIANIATSVLFVIAHLAEHAPAWAAAVMVPSLVFGYFRDRYRHLLPSLLLHSVYNGCYLLLGANQT